MPRYQVAPVAAIAANTMRGFQLGDRRILIVNCDGKYYALDELCPHLSVPLGRGELKDGRITCAGHGSVFDVRTGEACKWIGKPVNWLTRLTEGRPTNARTCPVMIENDQLVVDL